MHQNRYPFSAIVGQHNMKLALLLNAVNPRLGGVLVRGEKGTAKSTAVRALAELLPKIDVVKNCLFSCNPHCPDLLCHDCRERMASEGELPKESRPIRVVDLPVGSTEDRLVGTLDIEKAIQQGEKRFEPGILAEANRGILYVDEVNLLEDHLVDVLLDAAAMGVNTVEREGISLSHPAELLLIGTMNPEEGELRPQLLDRFALCVEVHGEDEVTGRTEVVRRRTAFEADPEGFRALWAGEEESLSRQLERARELLPQVVLQDAQLELIARLAISMKIDGHRGDIVIARTATTLAAFHERRRVEPEDLFKAASLALPHRMRRKPFQDVGVEAKALQEAFSGAREASGV